MRVSCVRKPFIEFYRIWDLPSFHFHICVLHAFHSHLFSPSFIWTACLQCLTEVVRNHIFLDTAIRKENFSSNHLCLVWWVAQSVKNLPAVQETQVRSLGWDNPLEKETKAKYSSIPAWKIPWTEELGGLQTMDLQESDMT